MTKETETKEISKSELEQLFNNLQNTIGEEIEEKINAAYKLLDEACDLSEQHGLPFYSNASHVGQRYIPESFPEKFGSIKDNIEKITGVYYSDSDCYGWENSQIC